MFYLIGLEESGPREFLPGWGQWAIKKALGLDLYCTWEEPISPSGSVGIIICGRREGLHIKRRGKNQSSGRQYLIENCSL